MKTGDIVRQLAADGNPIGSYYKVVKTNKATLMCKKFIDGRTIYAEKVYVISKEDAVVQSCMSLHLSGLEAYALFCTQVPTSVIQHYLTKLWEIAANEKPDVLRLYHTPSGAQVYVSYEKIEKVVRRIGGKNLLYIRITGITFLS